MMRNRGFRATTISAAKVCCALFTAAVLVTAGPAHGEEVTLQSPCQKGALKEALRQLLELERNAAAPSPLDGKVFVTAPTNIPLLDQNVTSTVDVMWAIPTNRDEHRRVYSVANEHAKADPARRKKWEANGRAYTRAFGSKSRLHALADFDAAMARKDYGVHLLIGHNEHGRLRMLDGSTANLNDLADKCSAAGKLCVFLSCDSNAFVKSSGVGIDRSINATEARWMAVELTKYLAARKHVTANEVAKFVERQSGKTGTKYRLVYVAQKGCQATLSATAIALVVCSVDDDRCGLTPASAAAQ